VPYGGTKEDDIADIETVSAAQTHVDAGAGGHHGDLEEAVRVQRLGRIVLVWTCERE
jgi:hypothetical protein